MSTSKILVKDVYSCPIANKIMYWKLNNNDRGNTVLEWTVAESGKILSVCELREYKPSTAVTMKALQQPERMVEMDDLDARMLNHFLERDWLQTGLIFQRNVDEFCNLCEF